MTELHHDETVLDILEPAFHARGAACIGRGADLEAAARVVVAGR
ncbi:hypothetical protein [Cellulosimicrobium cellulans]|nr:hypothetical protein [Cellulosimicrobium cellulans]